VNLKDSRYDAECGESDPMSDPMQGAGLGSEMREECGTRRW
jgi:hypothetical protein